MCSGDGIGRHTWPRTKCRKAWEFKSPPEYQKQTQEKNMNCWAIVDRRTGKIVEVKGGYGPGYPEVHLSRNSARSISGSEYPNDGYTIKKVVVEIRDWNIIPKG